MNKTHAKQAVSLIKTIVSLDDTGYQEARPAIHSYIDFMVSSSTEGNVPKGSQPTTESEWDFIEVLRCIDDALKAEPDNSKDMLNKLRRRLEKLVEQKLRVVFFVQEYSLWPSYRTIYEYLNSIGTCDIKLVYIYVNGRLPAINKEENIQAYKDAGFDVIDMKEFSLAEYSPDLVFYEKPYYQANGAPKAFYVEEVGKHVRYTAFISYCLDVQGGDKLIKFFYVLPAFYFMWKVFAYSEYYETMLRRYSFCDSENIASFAHPKFDGVHEILNDESRYRLDAWDELIDGRPVVLWNSHFSVQNGGGVGTFFQHREAIFRYFETHKDIVLLWRPHPYFWSEVAWALPGGEVELDSLLAHLSSMSNVIVDRNDDYRMSFASADALISDAATFLVEFGITGKPVLYTVKLDGERIINEMYLEGIGVSQSDEDVVEFLESIRTNPDLKARRRSPLEDVFGECDGHNGERIGAYLLEEIDKDCDGIYQRILAQWKDQL